MGTSINRGVKLTTGRSTFLDRDALRNSSIWPMEGNSGPWAVANPTGGSDPDYASVVLHVPFQSDLLDTKSHALTSETSTPTITGAQSPYAGGSSALFVASNLEKLRAVDSVDFEMGSGDFTAEFWLRTVTTSANQVMFGKFGSDASSSSPYLIQRKFNANNWNFLADIAGGGVFEYNHLATTIVADTWYHLALVREGTTFRSFIDGIQVNASGVIAGSGVDNANDLVIGALFNVGSYIRYLDGYMADLRLTKGVARYNASGFTLPTTPFPTS